MILKPPKFVELKVYQNKSNKQRTIVLPAKDIKLMGKKAPKTVRVTW
jgi:hypothetical protein